MKYMWIGLGGALGAISRYAVGIFFCERFGTRFPYGTLAVNISGCFAVGLIVALLDARSDMPSFWRYGVPVGFVGAYTTFSTFELETLRAVQDGFPGTALLNILLSVAFGYAAVWLGLTAGHRLG